MLALPVALDFSSRFFSLILGKDSKYSAFLKEWDYFKTLLMQSPADMGGICDYLGVIQLRQDGIHIHPETKTSSEPTKGKTRSAIRKKQRLNRLQSYAIPPEFALATATHLPSLPSTPDCSSEDEAAALQSTKQFLSESEQDLPSLQMPSMNSYSEFSVTHLKSDESLKTEKDVGTSSNTFEEKRKPYNVALLKSKAYSMTRALKTNSDGFVEKWQNKQDKQRGDFRTPLRGMVLYENHGKDFLDLPRISYKVQEEPFSDDSFFADLKKVTTETSQDSSSSNDLKYVRSREKTKSNMEEALEQLAMKILFNVDQAVLQKNKNVELI